jgi:hypothetical protein
MFSQFGMLSVAMKTRRLILILAVLAGVGFVFAYVDTGIRPTAACRNNSGEVVCPPAYKPN